VTHSLAADSKTLILDDDFDNSLRGIGYGQEEVLAQKVFAVASVIDKRVLNMLRDKFHLATHLAALKKFLLLSQGDFVTLLMDTLGIVQNTVVLYIPFKLK
jgi:hypothetical protein